MDGGEREARRKDRKFSFSCCCFAVDVVVDEAEEVEIHRKKILYPVSVWA